jgi:hypothetical protein
MAGAPHMSQLRGAPLLVASSLLGAIGLTTLAGCPKERPLGDRSASAAPDIDVPVAPSAAPTPAAAAAPTEGPPFATDRAGFVGILSQNAMYSQTSPSAYCLEDDTLYRGADARVGDLNLFIDRDVSSFAAKPVLVRGSREPSLLSALREVGPCPAERPEEHAQMRSDWVSPEGGFRTTRDRLRDRPFLRGTEIVALDLGSMLDGSGERVIVELKNPFDRAMDGLRAVAHYEGGPGKPMPRYEPVKLSLPPGGSQRLDLAARVEAGPAGQDSGEPRGMYALTSVDLEGTLGAVDVKVSIPARVGRIPKR